MKYDEDFTPAELAEFMAELNAQDLDLQRADYLEYDDLYDDREEFDPNAVELDEEYSPRQMGWVGANGLP